MQFSAFTLASSSQSLPPALARASFLMIEEKMRRRQARAAEESGILGVSVEICLRMAQNMWGWTTLACGQDDAPAPLIIDARAAYWPSAD